MEIVVYPIVMIIKRDFQHTLEKRLHEDRPRIQVIVGPRQVGKTTAIKSALSGKGLYQTADSPTPLGFDVILEWWNQAYQLPEKILVIDEVQKINGWAEVIKKLWDSDEKKIKLILSGSAALSIEKNLRESLAGRFELIKATHWNFNEFQKVFKKDLKTYIEYGCYPGAMEYIDHKERWAEYIRDSIVEPAIGRDILQVHPIENPALLRHVFALTLQLPSQIISLNKMQGQLQDKGAIATIQHYLNLLNAAYLVTGLQKYSASGFRQKSSSPKVIVHNNALLRAFERPLEKRLSDSEFGLYFENSVGARLIESGCQVFYWKEKNLEVDFVVETTKGEKLAIEVKSGKISLSDLKPLFSFCKTHKEFQPCLVSYLDQQIEGVRTLSAEKVLAHQI